MDSSVCVLSCSFAGGGAEMVQNQSTGKENDDSCALEKAVTGLCLCFSASLLVLSQNDLDAHGQFIFSWSDRLVACL